ncbi:MAG TPA: hypothetical protein VM242_14505 [Acidimicrobiales bacterium]|jgi:hypothetical protein|nr:hypothetical protein [Acidimicrobiales bacterium]
MSDIVVTAMGPDRFGVQVHEAGGVETSHVVTVPQGFLDDLGIDAPPGDVVRESIAFLLDREPATSILAEFELPVISEYFGDYPDELRRRLA